MKNMLASFQKVFFSSPASVNYKLGARFALLRVRIVTDLQKFLSFRYLFFVIKCFKKPNYQT